MWNICNWRKHFGDDEKKSQYYSFQRGSNTIIMSRFELVGNFCSEARVKEGKEKGTTIVNSSLYYAPSSSLLEQSIHW